MDPLRWTMDDFVFLPQLDADHQKLFDDAEAVRESLVMGRPSTELRFDLFRLQKSLSVHLASEERLMRESRYPARRWHEQQHRAGRNKIARLIEASRGNIGQQVFDTLEEFASWLRDDVHMADRMLAAHLRNDRRGRLAS